MNVWLAITSLYVILFIVKHRVQNGLVKIPRDKFPDYAKVLLQWVPPWTTLNSVDDIENASEKIYNILKDAITAVGRRTRRGNGKSAAWWTADCETTQLTYRSTVNTPERYDQAKIDRKVVPTAKTEN